MKRRLPIVCLIMMPVLLFYSCKKNKSNISGGGFGGNAILTVSPEHHGLFVDSCTIFIKYGTNDAPADGIYDDSSVCVLNDTTPVAIFKGLTKGLYYLYGRGYHYPYVPPYVKGGLPVTISTEDSQNVFLPTYSYDL